MLRRLAAIGDIHCQDAALERALAELRAIPTDAVFALGDIVDGRGDADRACDLLRDAGVLAIAGNHERWLLGNELRTLPDATMHVEERTRAFLASLPPSREVDTVAGKLFVGHGVGDDDMRVLKPDTKGYELQTAISEVRGRTDVRYFLGGHTHRRMVRALGPFVFFNAGTLLPDHDPCFLVIDFEAQTARFYDLDAKLDVRPSEPIDLASLAPVDFGPAAS
jgi:predicted phosphodiesterase